MFEMGGGEKCGGCKSWEEDIYWSHFQFIHFTQILSTDYVQQLALPKTFSDKMKNKLPENVSLKGPSGVMWNIGLTTRDETLYFTHGWQQFVKDHSLKEKDSLVFKFNGKSIFEVLIFDGNSFCEKAASYFVGNCGHTQQEDTKGKEFIADEVTKTKTKPAAVPARKTGKMTNRSDDVAMPVLNKKRGRRLKQPSSSERSPLNCVA